MASIATSTHLPALGEPHEREAIGGELHEREAIGGEL
jgi:hypothetical protein